MSEQLALVDVPTTPRLTDRQQAVQDALERASHDGLTADEAGAIAHNLKTGRWHHSPDDRCLYCTQDGKQILHRLKELGLARYRRANRLHPGAWLTTTEPPTAPAKPAEPLAPVEWDGIGPMPDNYIPF